MITSRRSVLRAAAAGALGTVLQGPLASPAIARSKMKLLVIGGGAGGATAAKYLALGDRARLDVTLIEPNESYTTCYHSNLWLGGFKTYDAITHSYDKLTSYGVRHVRRRAEAIDRGRQQVRLDDGSMLPYDRLVLSPGIDIDFGSISGYSEAASEKMPHAWKPGPQMPLLKKQLDALTDASTIVMVTPPNPYRCPPGPYERASVMAHVLTAKGHKNSRIVILDPKDTFSKQALFQEGWEEHYPGMIEWQDPQMHGGIMGVDPDTMEVKTDLETYRADLANIIPAQRAGRIARDTGLTDRTGYCPIDPTSMRSLEDRNIHIIGDACIAGDMPKSAFSANSQAKVVAMTIMADLAGRHAFPARYATVCWSFIAPDNTVKVGGSYRAKDGRITSVDSFISQKEDNPALRKRNGEENLDWYAAMAVDIFG